MTILLTCLRFQNSGVFFRAAHPLNAGPTPQQIQQQLLALNNSPYGDSPLFWNLKQVSKMVIILPTYHNVFLHTDRTF
jgi:hypothetical protein